MNTKSEDQLNSTEKDVLNRWRQSSQERNELEAYLLSLKWHQFKEEKKVLRQLEKVNAENSLLLNILHKNRIL